ncbi:hypothetical protein SAMN04487898_105167 [Pedobacter sp. ok626]|uniref:hypothetical protein n=1 Tax=Pedobacter sp. ok626 TaxID=1761882 RepID=UPI000886B06C|nr:hypothetical protein [Pedobacter sp. ok626]SDJ96468.1 hypothetical protein SAMN04487898_105167 [Pedobacter sp. ok626]
MVGYGIKYKCEFESLKGLNYRVYILQRGYNSAVYDLRMGGNPIQINYTSSSENKFEVIRGSECVLNFFSEYDGQFAEIMYADKNDFLVQVFIREDLHWQGYIINDNYSEPFASAPYPMSLRATDGLGDLKLIDFAKEDGTVFLSNITFAEAILNCLALLKNGTQLVTSNDLFEFSIDRNVLTNEAFNHTTVSPFMFLKDELNPKKCSEIIKMILELFQCYIYYKAGKYYIERVNYKLNETISRRTYNINFTGDQSIVNTFSTENIRGEIERNGSLTFINFDHNSTFVPPFNKITVENSTIDPNNTVINNYFRYWDESNIPKYWVKSGNISIAKKELSGEKDILQIITKANDNQIGYSTNMLSASKTSYNGRMSITSPDELAISIQHKGNVRLMVRATDSRVSYYLSCETFVEDNEVSYTAKFDATANHCKIKHNTIVGTNNWATATLNVKMPNLATKFEIAVLPSFVSDTYSGDCYIREVTATVVAGKGARTNGYNYSIISTRNTRETYDQFSPQLGEFGNLGIVNQILMNTKDGRVNPLWWFRSNKTESKALLEIGVHSILNQYRTAFRLFSGSFNGDFDYSKVYQIETLGGVYMPYKASSDLKYDTHKVDLFELLDDTDVESDKYERMRKFVDGKYTIANAAYSTGTPRPSRG